jgi:hypothetical protein
MASARGSIRPPLIVFLTCVGISGGVIAWYTSWRPPTDAPVVTQHEPTLDPPPPDPRLTFPTPFRNVRPTIQYVGDAVCAGCHPTIDKRYHGHPMGRSAEFLTRATPIEQFSEEAKPRFASGPYELQVEQTATGLQHRVMAKDAAGSPLTDYVVSADVVIGSGTRGRSYLTYEQGALWQTPISWFTPDARWDVSPGFDLGHGGRRPILPECLFCHVDRVEAVPHAHNRYREPLLQLQASIGCERCHGPGELHVAERKAGMQHEGVDTSIVNPRHLPYALQQAICEQCHLQGEERITRRGRNVFEFRPGLPFEQFVTVFVRPPELMQTYRSVGQFEQLEQSRCTLPTGEKLTCTSCHDPHSKPPTDQRDSFYRARCLSCHESRGCTLPAADRAAKKDNCITCHMPTAGSANIVHASVTDHRILRRPVASTPARTLLPGQIPLIAFRQGEHAPPIAERERDLGIALARAAVKIPPGLDGTQYHVANMARDRLSAALTQWPGDPEAWIAMSLTRHVTRELPEQLQAAQTAVRLLPDSEAALEALREAAFECGQPEVALEAATRLVGMNPTAPEPLLARAVLYLRQRNWPQAEADCRAALKIHPLHPRAHLQLAACLYHKGKPDEARKQLETAVGLTTSTRQRMSFLDWYQRETR